MGSSPPDPLAGAAAFVHLHASRLGAELSSRLNDARIAVCSAVSAAASHRPPPPPKFAAVSRSTLPPPPPAAAVESRITMETTFSPDVVARTLKGTPVYTVSNANNEFVLVSDPGDGVKSLGLLCFRREDAQALLAQVQTRQPALGRGARVVPITLDQVYMLKVEGIAFRFLPDPMQIKNAIELKAADHSKGFEGVPVFQSDLLTVKKKNRRYCPIYFRREDIERELVQVPKTSRSSAFSQNIMVGSLEDVLKRMEINGKKSGWDDLIFIPPGKNHIQHIDEAGA